MRPLLAVCFALLPLGAAWAQQLPQLPGQPPGVFDPRLPAIPAPPIDARPAEGQTSVPGPTHQDPSPAQIAGTLLPPADRRLLAEEDLGWRAQEILRSQLTGLHPDGTPVNSRELPGGEAMSQSLLRQARSLGYIRPHEVRRPQRPELQPVEPATAAEGGRQSGLPDGGGQGVAAEGSGVTAASAAEHRGPEIALAPAVRAVEPRPLAAQWPGPIPAVRAWAPAGRVSTRPHVPAPRIVAPALVPSEPWGRGGGFAPVPWVLCGIALCALAVAGPRLWARRRLKRD
jgi:hypothetical protein